MEETTTKKKKEIPASHSYKCTNPSCQKTFTNPIKVENLSLNNSTVYEACPYCLTEITVEKSFSVSEKQKPVDKRDSEVFSEADKKIQPAAETDECKHYFGYLSERTRKEGLPEECMLCGKIVQCMLKKIV
ncbi:MAG: hypothetical protein ACPLKQ_00585 [Candidatus Bathyarchaeales archaeon]